MQVVISDESALALALAMLVLSAALAYAFRKFRPIYRPVFADLTASEQQAYARLLGLMADRASPDAVWKSFRETFLTIGRGSIFTENAERLSCALLHVLHEKTGGKYTLEDFRKHFNAAYMVEALGDETMAEGTRERLRLALDSIGFQPDATQQSDSFLEQLSYARSRVVLPMVSLSSMTS